MAATLFNRYIWLADNIFRAGERGITFEEINRRWVRSQYNETEGEYPERSFHRHKNEIKELFDIDIECNKRTGCYYIANAEDMEQGGVRTWLLNTFAVNNLINESHHLKRRILFENIPSGRQYLTPIIEAMRDGMAVSLSYKSFKRDEVSTFEVCPYCVKVFRQRWYMLARSVGSERLRTYALDRIVGLLPTETPFTLPKDFDAAAYFAGAFGIIVNDGSAVETVRIKVDAWQCNYLRTLPLHASQQEVETTDDYSVFTYRLRPTFDFRQELHSLGAAVEVLAPAQLRDDFAAEAARMAAMYRKAPNESCPDKKII